MQNNLVLSISESQLPVRTTSCISTNSWCLCKTS